MKYYIIAGEASGDLHASALMHSIKQQDHMAQFRFFGGDKMQAEGGVMVKHYMDMAFMGFIPVLMNLRTIFRNMDQCKRDVLSYKPDVLILVDYPSFNLKIAKFVKENMSIPVYYYISPKIWAWKEWRIKSIKKYIDRMFCILPFEVGFYKKHNYKVDYVGNPTVDELTGKAFASRAEFIKKNSLPDKPIIALLAGSRKNEVKVNLPLMMKAADAYPEYQVVLAGAPGLDMEFYDSIIGSLPVKIVFNQTFDLLSNARAALVTSGTATLETAVFNVPQVVCYNFSGGRLVYKFMQSLLKVDYISLVNLIVDARVVEELLGPYMTLERLTYELGRILPDGADREAQLEGYRKMKGILGDVGAPDKAALLIVSLLRDMNENN